MRNLKKVLVMVLALAMMLSIMVVGAGAAFTDQKDIDPKHQEAVDMAIALKIIEGYPDGSFQPNGNVTRAEMAKIICIALNGGQVPATSVKPTPSFADIDNHWAEGFIEYCYAKGVVAGKSADVFDPSGNVTGSEAAKMLLVALGYNQDVEKYVGPEWELYVNVQANQDGLYKELLDIETAEPLSREHAAQMIWNALQSKVIVKESQIDRTTGNVSDTYKYGDKQMLDKFYDGVTFKGQLTDWSYSSKDKNWTYTVYNDEGKSLDVKSSIDYTALIGQQVKAVYDTSTSGATKDAYGIFAVDSQVLYSGLVADLPTLKPGDDSFTISGTKYKLDNKYYDREYPNVIYADGTVANAPVYEFSDGSYLFGDLNDLAGKLYTVDKKGNKTYSDDNIKDNDSLNFSAIDYDGNGKVDFFMVQPVIIAKVGSVNNSDIIIKNVWDPCRYQGVSLKYAKADVNYYDGLARNDWVAITPAKATANDTDTFVKLDLLNGKVATMDKPTVTVDGTSYKLDVSYDKYNDVKAGTTFKDAPLYNNFIFAGDISGNHKVTDYVVVLGSDKGAYAETAKLLFSDGTKKVVDLNTKNTSANSLKDYGLYTYETNKDQEYTLKEANTTDTGFDLAAMGSDVITTPASKSAKVGYINGYTVADDAVIFIKDTPTSGNPDVKVITGARLKTMADDQFAIGAQKYVLGTDSSSNGKGLVNMAYLVTGEKSVKSADSLYGYITGVSTAQNDNSQDIYKVTVFTKDGRVTLDTISGLDSASKKILDAGSNQAIAYTVDNDGAIDEIQKAGTGKPVDMNAITGKDTKALWIDGVGPYDLADNVVYLIVDFDAESGVEAGSFDRIDIADKDAKDNYIPNSIVFYDSANGEITCVVSDVNNGSTL